VADKQPFTRDYVLKATAKHIRRSIDISIRKTNDRWKEFKDDPDLSKEVMYTLMVLHDLRKNLDDFQAANFKENSHG
jgi:hypothetical protein